MNNSNRSKHGFTLTELAIVITLLALILGGIIVGQNMMRSAELRAVTTEVARYTRAVHEFRDKFRALPGDFSEATTIWGAANVNTASCSVSVGVGTQTCNGNGDGRIAPQNNDSAGLQYEQFRAWQHMGNAALLEGKFSGVAGPLNVQDAVLKTNVPASRLAGAGYSIISITSNEAVGNAHYYPLNYMHMLQLGADLGDTVPSTTLAPALTTQEAFALDAKQDDGLPASGNIIAAKKTSPYTPDCTDNDTASLARYDNEQEGYKCSLLFLLGL
jgi:prepilin-type N-terminal cleavage/methylation domain-containing protein